MFEIPAKLLRVSGWNEQRQQIVRKTKMNSSIRPKIKFAQIALLVSLLCGQSVAQDFKPLKDGIEYAEVTREISGLNVNMNLLRLDLKKVRLDVHHAMDAAIGTEKTSSIATRHGAFAAINAGFFRLDTSIFAGDPVGALQIDGKILHESSNDRIALLISNSLFAPVLMERIRQNYDIRLTSKARRISEPATHASGVNRERKKGEIVVFTPEFGRTTLTNNDGTEVIVRPGKCSEVRQGQGSSLIPSDGFVISAETTRAGELASLSKCTTRATLYPNQTAVDKLGNLRLIFPPGNRVEDIVAGAPQLIQNSKIDITWQEEKSSKSFVETRHPRTAVAKLKDGKFLMITVDGRTESSGGIGLQDLAEYLLSLGATDAMNLDGGGSTTMFVDGKVVNHPSDKEGERKVSDAILVTPRSKK